MKKIIFGLLGTVLAIALYCMFFGRAHLPIAIAIFLPLGIIITAVLFFADKKKKANPVRKTAASFAKKPQGFYKSFKHCGVFGKDWVVANDSITVAGEKIEFSKINKIFDIKTGNQPILQFRAFGKRYVLDCWGTQAEDFEQATAYLGLRSSDPDYSIYVPNYESLSSTAKAQMAVRIRKAEIDKLISKAESEKLSARLDATDTPYDFSLILASQQYLIDQIKQRQVKKDIIKGAVIGGVVAGPAGAVVGAEIGKVKSEMK